MSIKYTTEDGKLISEYEANQIGTYIKTISPSKNSKIEESYYENKLSDVCYYTDLNESIESAKHSLAELHYQNFYIIQKIQRGENLLISTISYQDGIEAVTGKELYNRSNQLLAYVNNYSSKSNFIKIGNTKKYIYTTENYYEEPEFFLAYEPNFIAHYKSDGNLDYIEGPFDGIDDQDVEYHRFATIEELQKFLDWYEGNKESAEFYFYAQF
ncbi:MAG: hypothetical protein RL660_2332 [Bacteroidota bacterium]|jgi:hypothetical protein